MKITNPANGEVIKEISEDNGSSVAEKFNKARTALTSWKGSSLDFRLSCIQKFQELLDIHKTEIASTLHREVGKPMDEALNEISGARTRIKYFLQNVKEWISDDHVHQDGNTKEIITYDPLGVICNISAWNYPILVGVNVFIPALLCGNCVLYKPSEFSTLTGLLIEKYLHLAGIPKDVFAAIIGGKEIGEKLLELNCDGYFFTGSYATGKSIAEKVSGKLVPVGLELGGKDPLYVTDDVDTSLAAEDAAEGAFYNDGQSCCAVERIYVHEKVYNEFIEKFVQAAEKFEVGPVTRGVHLNFLEGQVQDALKKGAKLLTGGKRTGAGQFFNPTVLVNVTHDMSLMKDETFGPVIGLMKVRSDEEAVELMNDTDFGLTASVFSRDIKRAELILSQVESGSSYINCCDRVSPYLPWSGRKNSGLGSTLSHLGILSFVKPRSWHIRVKE